MKTLRMNSLRGSSGLGSPFKILVAMEWNAVWNVVSRTPTLIVECKLRDSRKCRDPCLQPQVQTLKHYFLRFGPESWPNAKQRNSKQSALRRTHRILQIQRSISSCFEHLLEAAIKSFPEYCKEDFRRHPRSMSEPCPE